MVAGSFNLGVARGAIIIDASGVSAAMDQSMRAVDSGVAGIGERISNMGDSISAVGMSLSKLFAPAAAGFAAATMQAMSFEESIANIGAVLNLSVDEMNAISESLQNIGEDTRYGANEVALAFYDIVGGVADASKHMAIMETAIHTAQAGNADLAGTTQALISIMNGYSFAADKAGFASDVLTRAVGMGVGTMDEFGAALPMVAGLANSVGIEFDDLGTAMAFITTKGVSASEAATQLQGMINALIRPSADMEAALKKIGFESGMAAIKQLGLVGTFNALKDSGADIPAITGRIEGLRGAIALTGDDFQAFSDQFAAGIDGATAAAEAIQMESAAAKFDLFKASVEDVAITIGNALLPALTNAFEKLDPILEAVASWVAQNPELVSQIATIAVVGLALGGVLAVVGTAISAIGAIIAVALGSIGLIVAGVAMLYLAFKNNFLGIRDLLEPIMKNVVIGFTTLFGVIGNFGNIVANQGIGEAIASIINAFMQMFGLIGNDEMSTVAQDLGNGIVGAFIGVAEFMQNSVLPVLADLYNWFVTDALPAIVGFVTGVAVPAIERFVGFLQEFWTAIQPGLNSFFTWVTQEALPLVVDFFSNVLSPAINSFITGLGNIWAVVGPVLAELFNWFMANGLPFITDAVGWFIDNIAAPLISILGSIWESVGPILGEMLNWFITTGLPAINEAITWFKDSILQPAIDILEGLWIVIEPVLAKIYDWFVVTALPAINTAVTWFKDNIITPLSTLISGLWESVRPSLEAIYNWFRDSFQWIGETFIKPVVDFIQKIIDGVSNALNELAKLGGGGGVSVEGSGGTPTAADLGIKWGDSFSAYDMAKPYMVGTGAQPELFMPGGGGTGTKIPNIDKVLEALGGGQGGDTYNVVIYANSRAGGEAAAEGFTERFNELKRRSG